MTAMCSSRFVSLNEAALSPRMRKAASSWPATQAGSSRTHRVSRTHARNAAIGGSAGERNRRTSIRHSPSAGRRRASSLPRGAGRQQPRGRSSLALPRSPSEQTFIEQEQRPASAAWRPLFMHGSRNARHYWFSRSGTFDGPAPGRTQCTSLSYSGGTQKHSRPSTHSCGCTRRSSGPTESAVWRHQKTAVG